MTHQDLFTLPLGPIKVLCNGPRLLELWKQFSVLTSTQLFSGSKSEMQVDLQDVRDVGRGASVPHVTTKTGGNTRTNSVRKLHEATYAQPAV